MKHLSIHQNLIFSRYVCEDGTQFWNLTKLKDNTKNFEVEEIASDNIWSFLDLEELK